MRGTMCAALIAGTLVAVPVAAHTPPVPTAAPQAPADEIVRGPKLGSPEIQHTGNGVSSPRLTKEVKAIYPPDLKNREIRDVVTLECVVLPDGTVGDVRVKEPVEPSYDKAAVTAVRQWKFVPAMRDGKGVPVRVEVQMMFSPPRKK